MKIDSIHTLSFPAKHYVFGDYVLTSITDAFSSPWKWSYWLSKKGWTKAQYCFSATNDSELESQLEHIDSYIKLFQETFEQTSAPTGDDGCLLCVIEENVDGCGGQCDMYVHFERPITKTQRDRFGELLTEVKEEVIDEDYDTEAMLNAAIDRFVEETGVYAKITFAPTNATVKF